MSSTNRNKALRVNLDYYPTPTWAVHRFLELCPLPGGKWLEPCAGDGAIIKAVNQVRSDILWTANEIQPEMFPTLLELAPLVQIQDFLTKIPTADYKVVITNPPFNLAMECVKKSFEYGAAHVVFLLRLNFLASKARAEFMAENTPDVYVLSNRPSFTVNGERDSIDYAWFVWHRDRLPNSPGKLVMIPSRDKK